MRQKFLGALVFILALTGSHSAFAADKTELTWYGHSAFKIETPKHHVLYIDPWIINPVNPDGQSDLAKIDKADLILVSHGHFDHVGNTREIASQTKARLVATFDLGNALVAYGQFPKERMGYDTLGNFGGTLRFFDGEVSVTFIPAVHSSTVNAKDLKLSETDRPETAGNPAGFLITIQNGPTIYHTGDTDVFGDMALISERHPVDLMLSCIGDHFTMGPESAAKAVALVKPRQVIPMHYGTYPGVLTGTVSAFKAALNQEKAGKKLRVMEFEKPLRF